MDAVGPHLGIVVDCFHWYCSSGTLESLEKNLAGRTVVNVHANDALPRPREEQLDGERALPMAYGTVDAPGVLRTLRKLNYDGPVIAEPFMPELERLHQLPSDDVAAEIGELMQRLMQASQ
jgi:sugar phosphate isomerase/epimerase